MRQLYVFMCVALFVSCENNRAAFSSTVNLEVQTIERNSKDIGTDTTYRVSVTYNNPVDAPNYLRDSIQRGTNLLFASWFDVSDKYNLSMSVKKHMDEYLKQTENNSFSNYNYFNLKINPNNVYQNKSIISFSYNWFIFEGGAHGNYGKYCFTLIKKDGDKISYNNLVKEDTKDEFLKIAESEFRAQSGIKEGDKIPDLYRFKDDKFHLTPNFAFTASGLVFYYNPYEIAPYSAGLIELLLPYDKIRDYVNFVE